MYSEKPTVVIEGTPIFPIETGRPAVLIKSDGQIVRTSVVLAAARTSEVMTCFETANKVYFFKNTYVASQKSNCSIGGDPA